MIGYARYHLIRWFKLLVRGRTQVRRGDLVALTAEGGGAVLAKVLFLSEYFRSVVEVRVWPVDADSHASGPPTAGPSYVLFVGCGSIEVGDWPIVGHETPTEDELRLLEFYSAGDVWFGDTVLRRASQAERARLPELTVPGNVLVERIAAMLLRGESPDWVFQVP